MIIKIKMSKQNGDKRIHLYSLFLGVTVMALVGTLLLTTRFFTWYIEGAEMLLLASWVGIPLTLLLWFFIKRSYYKISFNEGSLKLYSFLPFSNRQIKYSDIIKITIDNKSNKRRIETIDEFFEIDKADVASLELICNQKSLNLTVHNVA